MESKWYKLKLTDEQYEKIEPYLVIKAYRYIKYKYYGKLHIKILLDAKDKEELIKIINKTL